MKYFISCLGGPVGMLLSLPMVKDEDVKGLVERMGREYLGREVDSLLQMVRVDSMREEESGATCTSFAWKMQRWCYARSRLELA